MYFPPLFKVPGLHNGVWGIPQSASPDGIRLHPDAVIIYVDSGNANANDENDGTDPLYPKATVQAAVDSPLLTSHSVILVSGAVTESVVTPDYVTGPNYVSIVGAGPSRYAISWQSGGAAEIALDLRAVGWRIQNFRFLGQSGAGCVELRHTDTGANDIAIRTIIEDCYFDGLTTGLAGIVTHGCYDVWVVNCTFSLWHNAGGTATAFLGGTTPLAIPYRMHVVGCGFYDNDNSFDVQMNGSFIYNCFFQKTGYAYASTVVLRTTLPGNPGDDNMIFANFFEGDFSNAGGYVFAANDYPMGNFSNDTAEAEVDAATGLVIAVPT